MSSSSKNGTGTFSCVAMIKVAVVLAIILASRSESIAIEAADGRLLCRATVRIENDGYGSGILVQRLARDGAYLYYFLSVEHVTGRSGRWPVETFASGSSQRHTATILGANRENDVSFGYFRSDEWLPVFPIARRAYNFPFDAIMAGCSSGEPDWRYASVAGESDGQWTTTTDVTDSGDSGGAMIDESGEIVGLVSASNGVRSYFVSLDDIHALLRRHDHEWLYRSDSPSSHDQPVRSRATGGDDPTSPRDAEDEITSLLQEVLQEVRRFRELNRQIERELRR